MPRRPRNPSGFVRKHPDTTSVRWQGIVKYPDPDKPGEWKQRSATFKLDALPTAEAGGFLGCPTVARGRYSLTVPR